MSILNTLNCIASVYRCKLIVHISEYLLVVLKIIYSIIKRLFKCLPRSMQMTTYLCPTLLFVLPNLYYLERYLFIFEESDD